MGATFFRLARAAYTTYIPAYAVYDRIFDFRLQLARAVYIPYIPAYAVYDRMFIFRLARAAYSMDTGIRRL